MSEMLYQDWILAQETCEQARLEVDIEACAR